MEEEEVQGLVEGFKDLEGMLCAEHDQLKEDEGTPDQRAGRIEKGFAGMNEESEKENAQ